MDVSTSKGGNKEPGKDSTIAKHLRDLCKKNKNKIK